MVDQTDGSRYTETQVAREKKWCMAVMKVAPVAFQVVLDAADLQHWPVPEWAREVLAEARAAGASEAEALWLDATELERLYLALMRSSGRPDLGLLIGASPAVVRYGILPSLIMNAPDLRRIIEVITHYAVLAQERSELRFEPALPCSAVYVDPLGSTPEGVRCRLEFILVGLTMIWRLAGGGRSGIVRTCFPYRRPDHAQAYEEAFDGELVYDAPHAALVFDSHMLDRGLPGADPVLFDAVRLRADMTLAELKARQSCVQTLIKTLESCLHERPRMADVAARMQLHERTLRRQLHEHGVTYNEVLGRVQLARAQSLLCQGEMSIQAVAQASGYLNVSAFHRAFLRSTGRTPGQWRRGRATGASLLSAEASTPVDSGLTARGLVADPQT